jgi:hypothetical protein
MTDTAKEHPMTDTEFTADDVEGHGRRTPFLPDEETDDVEGHGRMRLTGDDDEDDVDGHAIRGRG